MPFDSLRHGVPIAHIERDGFRDSAAGQLIHPLGCSFRCSAIGVGQSNAGSLSEPRQIISRRNPLAPRTQHNV